MKPIQRLSIAFGVIFSLLSASGCHSDRLKVKIISPEGQMRHAFKAEIADDPQERSQGLMYRKELGGDEGMLFIFTAVTESPFWMKNTLIPLDMIFISEDKTIGSIIANAEPQTETPRVPLESYRYVLEISGGRAQQVGIQVGDKVEF